MTLPSGARLGPYEVVAPVGAGGMGEVYRARDTRLDRTVAIKVLPAALAADPQLRERFEREARAVSSLQHPHICTLFDVGRDGDHEFLVLEYLEGETVADRLSRAGPLPFADALKIAVEICDALDKAHRSGIVHRDLKPANVMLVRSGAASAPPTAKLLDFGLAKAAAPVLTASGSSMLPTTPPNMTAQGTILGTFQYMAPEQLEGLEADARTDIFAFGALVFEMLTGRPAFEGKTRASLLGAILKDEPPRVSQLQPIAPPALDRIVATCLAKDPDDRYQSARDLLRDLKWMASGAAEAQTAASNVRPRSVGRGALAIASMLVIAALSGGFAVGRVWPPNTTPAEPIQFTIAPPSETTFATPAGGGTGLATQLAVSPDGRRVVFVGSTQNRFQLWLRTMGALDARPIAGTDDATFPFWSPDSQYVGFFAAGKLKKVGVAGGPPMVLCDALSGRGGTWNRDNVIVFSPATTGPLLRVSAAGGVPQTAAVLDRAYGESSHRFPSFLPDGRHFLFTGTIGTCCPPAKPGRIRIGALDSEDAVTLVNADSAALYSAGHLLFTREGTLMAAAFDVSTRRLTGDAFPVAESVASEGSRYASFSVSSNGALVYARGVSIQSMQATWFDRAGRNLGTVGQPDNYVNLALSHDARRVAIAAGVRGVDRRDIWILDAARGTRSRFTFDVGTAIAPVWSPDDSQVVFAGNRDGTPGLRAKRVAGTTNEELLLAVEGQALTPTDWSLDGKYIVFTRAQGVGGSNDIWALPLAGDRKPFAVIASAGVETNGVLSPNGRWIAYQAAAAEAPQTQVYVQPFPPTGGKFQISASGGYHPLWRDDGNEIYFVSPDGRIMAAPIDTTTSFETGAPVPLFAVATMAAQGGVGRQLAVAKDGRFLVNVLQQQSSSVPLVVMLNWPSTIQK